MTGREVLQTLHQRGMTLALHGPERLRLTPPQASAEDLRQAIRTHKTELLALVEAFEERAAIAEFCGGLTREAAERLAWACVLGEVTA